MPPARTQVRRRRRCVGQRGARSVPSSSLPPSLLAASVIFAGGGGAAKSRSSDASEGSFTAAEVQMSTERLRHKLRVLLAVALPIAFFAAGVSSVAAEEQRVRVGMIPDAGATQV